MQKEYEEKVFLKYSDFEITEEATTQEALLPYKITSPPVKAKMEALKVPNKTIKIKLNADVIPLFWLE